MMVFPPNLGEQERKTHLEPLSWAMLWAWVPEWIEGESRLSPSSHPSLRLDDTV